MTAIRPNDANASEPVDDFQAEFEKLVQLDQEWRDHFAQTNLPMRASAEEEEKRQFMFDSLVAGTSLQESAAGAGARFGGVRSATADGGDDHRQH